MKLDELDPNRRQTNEMMLDRATGITSCIKYLVIAIHEKSNREQNEKVTRLHDPLEQINFETRNSLSFFVTLSNVSQKTQLARMENQQKRKVDNTNAI
ncbi:hypothetical protein DICVIV_11687 [Dictyocaulus viviparus]|uniref:Uncharacterized protein n=1 Tax=Dictyocaulus viviparus TaxID=29172 RepID=A0A0D8XJ24_DICVI|nr:hypothetical protein DICVIV_11687 [Dictyocaulus viviparus]